MEVYHKYIGESNAEGKFLEANSLANLPNNMDIDKVQREIERLLENHTKEIWYGLREWAPSSVWRAERMHLPDEKSESFSRFAIRLHLFEKRIRPQRTLSLNARDCGRYLGYVTLRPFDAVDTGAQQGAFAYILIAHLAPPRRMLRSRYHLITCLSGAPDGVIPFRSTPFSVPHNTIDKAACIHNAMYEALVMKMTSFGFAPISRNDMLFEVWSNPDNRDKWEQIKREGVSLKQALEILRAPERVGEIVTPRAGGVIEAITAQSSLLPGMRKPDETTERSMQVDLELEAMRCLTDYLGNGLPVILELKFKKQTLDLNSPADHYHAVLMIGMHMVHDPEDTAPYWTRQLVQHAPKAIPNNPLTQQRLDIQELPGRFIIHDPVEVPYYEISSEKLLHQAWVESEGGEERQGGIYYLAIAPKNTKLGIFTLRKRARGWVNTRLPQKCLEAYSKCMETEIDFSDVDKFDGFRFVPRLLSNSAVKNRYFQEWSQRKNNKVLFEAFSEYSKQVDTAWWWCMEVRLPYAVPHESAASEFVAELHPIAIYFWSVADDPEERTMATPFFQLHFQKAYDALNRRTNQVERTAKYEGRFSRQTSTDSQSRYIMAYPPQAWRR